MWKQLNTNHRGRKVTLILDDLFSKSCWRQQNSLFLCTSYKWERKRGAGRQGILRHLSAFTRHCWHLLRNGLAQPSSWQQWKNQLLQPGRVPAFIAGVSSWLACLHYNEWSWFNSKKKNQLSGLGRTVFSQLYTAFFFYPSIQGSCLFGIFVIWAFLPSQALNWMGLNCPWTLARREGIIIRWRCSQTWHGSRARLT